MTGYTPGEQPHDEGIIKLNTNENPYPPSPRALAALEGFLASDRLRKYPDPLGTAFRRTAGRVLNVDPDSILIGNGSDDVLTIVTRAFVPDAGLVVSPTPSYLLYSTLAQLQCARFQTVAFTSDWNLPRPWPVPTHISRLSPIPTRRPEPWCPMPIWRILLRSCGARWSSTRLMLTLPRATP